MANGKFKSKSVAEMTAELNRKSKRGAPAGMKDGGLKAIEPSALERVSGSAGKTLERSGKFIEDTFKGVELNPVKRFLLENLVSEPLQSAGTALQDWSRTPRDLTPDRPFRPFLRGRGMTAQLDPRVVDVAPIARGVAGRVANTVRNLPTDVMRTALEAYGPQATAAYVVKSKGGNWLPEDVEGSMMRLKMLSVPDYENWANQNITGEAKAQADALRNWIETKLTRYVKNELATPEDPVRALAERNVSHLQGEPEGFNNPRLGVQRRRKEAGQDPLGAGTSELAKRWDYLADQVVDRTDARSLSAFERDKLFGNKLVPGETVVHRILRSPISELEFGHLTDELRNALDPNSGLPRNLQIQPKDLQKITVPQAVERVAKINEWRAAQKIEANKALANNAATVLHKEYPEQGYKWVELTKPESRDTVKGHPLSGEAAYNKLKDALKYEGDVMDHCVGRYCDDVASGNTRIYSLRDAKGEPHVTIEVKPTRQDYPVSGEEPLPPSITQIKGKQNLAPKEEYLPFVQDFVKSGRWGQVRELENAGLRRVSPDSDLGTRLREAGVDIPPYVTESELTDLLNRYGRTSLPPSPEGLAKGGPVHREDGGRMSAIEPTMLERFSGSAGQALERGGKFVEDTFKNIQLNPVKRFLLENLVSEPLQSAGTALQDWSRTPRDATEKYPFRPFIRGRGMTAQLDPRVVDVAPIANSLASRAANVARNLPADIARSAMAAYGPQATAAYAVKPKGQAGNWLGFSVDKFLDDIKPSVASEENVAINNWIDSKLSKYLKNEMATPEDPLRKLAERGTLHYSPPGTPDVDLAKRWESVSDSAVKVNKAENVLNDEFGSEVAEWEPWITKVPPEAKVYELSDDYDLPEKLGFSHLLDELKNAMRPTSDLPEDLRIQPKDLQKITLPQAVERVAKINEWRAAKASELDKQLAANAATFLHKEYPTVPGTELPNEQGFRWVNFRLPEEDLTPAGETREMLMNSYGVMKPTRQVFAEDALEKALKYEGDIMGHCVGGYCEDALSGRKEFFSLRDAEGEPRATIEVVTVGKSPLKDYELDDIKPGLYDEYLEQRDQKSGIENVNEWLLANHPDIYNAKSIEQIKGSGKKDDRQAIRIRSTGYKDEKDKDILPFIQDFVKSQNWINIKDTQNAGLRNVKDVFSGREIEQLKGLGAEIPNHGYLTGDQIQQLNHQLYPQGQRLHYDAQGNITGSDYAKGGPVRVSQDAMKLALIKRGLTNG